MQYLLSSLALHLANPWLIKFTYRLEDNGGPGIGFYSSGSREDGWEGGAEVFRTLCPWCLIVVI